MKQLLSLLLMVFLAAQGFGQTALEQRANEDAKEWSAIYRLNQEQADEMYVIQLRRLRNLEEIAGYKQTDQLLYIKKLKSIEHSTDVSIQRMLTKDQQKIHQSVVLERRKQRAELARKLSAEGAAPRDIEMALFELE